MYQELNSLSDWFRGNKLSLYISKTNYILFSNTDKQRLNLPEIKLANQVISKVESIKFLGIYMDVKLKWDTHINIVKKHITKSFFAINKACSK